MAQIPRGDEGRYCPFNGKECCEVCHKCPLWVQVRGTNPNTGAEVDRWDCSFAFLPMLLIENSQMQRQTGAAVESFRNETARTNISLQGVVRAATHMLAVAAPRPPEILLEQQGTGELNGLG